MKNKQSTRYRARKLFNNARGRAKRLGLEFDLTIDWVESRIISGYCPVTGFEFDLAPTTRTRSNPYAPSIDRIDTTGPYTMENCRVVVWIYNLARGEWGDTPLNELVLAIGKRDGVKQWV